MASTSAKWIMTCGTILVLAAGGFAAVEEYFVIARFQVPGSISGSGMHPYSLGALVLGSAMIITGMILAFRKSD